MSTAADKTDRFPLRLNPDVYEAIANQAESNNRSINGEICMALDSWLYNYEHMVLVKNRVVQSADPKTAKEIMAHAPVFDFSRENGQNKIVVRLKESHREDLKNRVEDYKRKIGAFTSQNAYLQMVLVWWLSYNYELQEFTKVLYQSFMSNLQNAKARPNPERTLKQLRIA